MVVGNTVVRATIKVNRKPQILGTSSPLTNQAIDLKFDTGDCAGGLTPQNKNGKNRPRRVCMTKG